MIERLKSRTLTAEDVRADIDAWLEAVMVVTTNAERHRVNLLRAKHFAKRHGVCVIQFPSNMVQSSARSALCWIPSTTPTR